MNLGNKILKIRKDNKMSQEEFADKLDVTRQTVSNWENEKNYPDIGTLIRISDLFNVSLDVLLRGDMKMIEEIDKKVKSNKVLKIIILVLIIFLFGFILLTITKNYFKVTKVGEEVGLSSYCIINSKLYEIGTFALINDDNISLADTKEMKPTRIYVKEFFGVYEDNKLKDEMKIAIDDNSKIEDIHNDMKEYMKKIGGVCTNYNE